MRPTSPAGWCRLRRQLINPADEPGRPIALDRAASVPHSLAEQPRQYAGEGQASPGAPPRGVRRPATTVGASSCRLANAIVDYLEIFHNRQRRRSALGMLSPIEFETRQPSTGA